MRASIVMAVSLIGAAFVLFAAFGAGGVAPLVALMVAHQRMCGRRHDLHDTVDEQSESTRTREPGSPETEK